jgi:hypothetical protein
VKKRTKAKKASKQFVILIKEQNGECACAKKKQKATKQAKEIAGSNGWKKVQGGISTSLLCTTITEKVTSESFENASSEAFATE